MLGYHLGTATCFVLTITLCTACSLMIDLEPKYIEQETPLLEPLLLDSSPHSRPHELLDELVDELLDESLDLSIQDQRLEQDMMIQDAEIDIMLDVELDMLDRDHNTELDAELCGGEAPTLERCDLIDNDCDGVIDEENICPCPIFGSPSRFWILCGSEAPDLNDREVNRATSWSHANTLCQEQGLELAVIRSEDENHEVIDAWVTLNNLPDYMSYVSQGIWIALRDYGNGEGFIWISEDHPYRRWDEGEPNSGAIGGEGCGALLTRPRNRRSYWDDRICDEPYMYVCQGP